MKRSRWEVLPIRGVFGWQVTYNGEQQRTFLFKYRAVAHAVEFCRSYLEAGELSELIIKGRDGKIKDSRTYGADPRGTLG